MEQEIELSDYIELVSKLCKKWERILHDPLWDFFELQAESFLIFYKCVDSHEPDKAKFITYFYNSVENRFKNIGNRAKTKPEGFQFPQTPDTLDIDENALLDALLLGNEGFCFESSLSIDFSTEGFVSLREALNVLPESAKSTMVAILNYNGVLGSRQRRSRRLKGGQPTREQMTVQDLLKPTGKPSYVLYQDLKDIRSALINN